LVRSGKIRRWGVSNFDVCDMEDLWRVPGGKNCAVDQVLYHVGSRGIEFDLLPWTQARGVAVMAYCPLAQAGTLARMNRDIVTDKTLLSVAGKYGVSVFQLMLAFTLRRPNLCAIPKASSPAHVEENAAAADLRIADEDWAKVDGAFWPPTAKMHLDIE
nr:aldo/keto reductase [Clostridia bacterium]